MCTFEIVCTIKNNIILLKNMKSIVCLIYVAFVATYFGSSLGNAEGEEVGHLHARRRAELQIVEELSRILTGCLNQSSNSDLSRLQSLQGIAEHQSFFRNLCNGLTTTRECLAVESTKWNGRYNETTTKLFTIFDNIVESSLQKGCETGGDSFAIITEGFHRHTARYNAGNHFVRECIIYGTKRWLLVLRSNASLATKIWFSYREIQNFKTCFAEYIPDEPLVKGFGELVDAILDKMNCLDPGDENLVLCKSINSSTIDRASVCPLRTKNESLVPLSMLLDQRLHSCYVVYEPYSMVFSNLTSVEQFRDYFANYCRRINRVKHCLNETTSAAEVCLNDAQFKNFKLVNGYLYNALESGCFENGKRLATIFHSVKMLRNNTNQRDTLVKCLTFVDTLKTQSYGDPTRIYQFYKELPVVRQCMIDNVGGGDSTFIEDVNSLIDDITKTMKCINTQNGSIVLCSTIENTPLILL